tara:strand:+ start:472 stop:1263 length:792 start_codon:yes stop_codon:yes gene_type:complete
MATITQAGIITILKTGTYPTTQKGLSYYQQKQKYPIYPFVEVRKIQSDSNTTDIQKTAIEQTFEVRFYMKYTRNESDEEADRLVTENEILRVLEVADISPTGKIYFESKTWSTSIIDDSIYGSRSVLRFSVKDVDTTSGSGLIGSNDKIELNSDGTALQIQILQLSTQKGFTIDTHTDDTRKIMFDPNNLTEHGTFSVTYENTTAIRTVIDSISASGEDNKGKLIRGGVATKYNFLIGDTSTSGSYGEVEKATTTFYATSTWT